MLHKDKKGLEMKICLKVFQRRMVPEGEKGSLVKVAVEILEREKERINKLLLKLSARLLMENGVLGRTLVLALSHFELPRKCYFKEARFVAVKLRKVKPQLAH